MPQWLDRPLSGWWGAVIQRWFGFLPHMCQLTLSNDPHYFTSFNSNSIDLPDGYRILLPFLRTASLRFLLVGPAYQFYGFAARQCHLSSLSPLKQARHSVSTGSKAQMVTVSGSERRSLQYKGWNGIRWHGIYWVQNLIVLQGRGDGSDFIYVQFKYMWEDMGRKACFQQRQRWDTEKQFFFFFPHRAIPPVLISVVFKSEVEHKPYFCVIVSRLVCLLPRLLAVCDFFQWPWQRCNRTKCAMTKQPICTLLFSFCLCSRTSRLNLQCSTMGLS